ncbi:hypothetical protein FOA52_015171 [Chlamydomonas sp. UWO 241]|nr:hypothetical protein FOA52_015171 [Chlamydomonas sp. UWO 241]
MPELSKVTKSICHDPNTIGHALTGGDWRFDAVVLNATPGDAMKWGIQPDDMVSLQARVAERSIRFLASMDWGVRPGTSNNHATLMLSTTRKATCTVTFAETGVAIKEVFTRIYTRGVWEHVAKNCGGGSGPGSCPRVTVGVRAIMSHLIETHRLASILDAPCGSFVWARLLLSETFPEMKYTGVDVACNVIDRRQSDEELMAKPNWQFHCVDISHQQLPPADMVFSRDAMQHLPIKMVLGFLNQVKVSGARWLAIGSYPCASGNKDIRIGDYYPIDLVSPPFNLTGVVQVFSENVWADVGLVDALAKSRVPGAMTWAPEADVNTWLAQRGARG